MSDGRTVQCTDHTTTWTPDGRCLARKPSSDEELLYCLYRTLTYGVVPWQTGIVRLETSSVTDHRPYLDHRTRYKYKSRKGFVQNRWKLRFVTTAALWLLECDSLHIDRECGVYVKLCGVQGTIWAWSEAVSTHCCSSECYNLWSLKRTSVSVGRQPSEQVVAVCDLTSSVRARRRAERRCAQSCFSALPVRHAWSTN